MSVPLELTGLTKVVRHANGPFVAVKDVNAEVEAGEFVAILGHSGCGKSTVLSIIAGLQRATLGGVVIDGTEVVEPGRRARGRLSGAVPAAVADGARERRGWRSRSGRATRRREDSRGRRPLSRLVGVADAADQLPAQLSLGTQQCVSLARALSLEPRFLLLDEPFSMLDSLTRFELQDTLLRVWEETGKIVVMVTHDVDEALYLADRLILMTDGPRRRSATSSTCRSRGRATGPPCSPTRLSRVPRGTSSTSSSTTRTSRDRARSTRS